MDYVTATLLLFAGIFLLGIAKVVSRSPVLVIVGGGLVISGLLVFVLTDTGGDDCNGGGCSGALGQSASHRQLHP